MTVMPSSTPSIVSYSLRLACMCSRSISRIAVENNVETCDRISLWSCVTRWSSARPSGTKVDIPVEQHLPERTPPRPLCAADTGPDYTHSPAGRPVSKADPLSGQRVLAIHSPALPPCSMYPAAFAYYAAAPVVSLSLCSAHFLISAGCPLV